MFTGIVEEVGIVQSMESLADSIRLSVRGPIAATESAPGDSIAVNGVCLTAVDAGDGQLSFDVMRETLERSSLGSLTAGQGVNLERAVVVTSRLGGHLVQGHVDGCAEILDRTVSEHWEVVRIKLPPELVRYVVIKGSITVDGVSLTVADLGADWFSVSLIPTTLQRTTLGHKAVGELVNLEVDVIAKYVESLMEERS